MQRRFATALAFSLAAWLPAQAQLPEPVAGVLRTTTIPEDAVSVLVLRGDQTILAHLADRPMQPASTMKLVTTLIGLDKLGPVFRGRTEFRTVGEQQGDVLKGDLYLRGGADMDLSTETLTTMLRSLRNQGIRRIDGHLVVDRQLFNPAREDLGRPPFDESPEAYYNVIPDALLVNKNMLQIDLRSIDSKRVRVASAARAGRRDGRLRHEAGRCRLRQLGSRLEAAGSAAAGRWRHEGDAARDLPEELRDQLRDQCDRPPGIPRPPAAPDLETARRQDQRGHDRRHDPAGSAPAGRARSRALPELVRDTNKPSDNTLARTIFLSLGALETDPLLGSHAQGGSAETTFSRSDAAVRGWMRAQGIDDTGLVLENGSGLSRTERITPIQMAGVLQAGLRSNWAPEFQASMPIVAVDGTMRRRLKDSPAAGRARLKTGTLSNVVALAGYVPDAQGRQCVLVAMVNSSLVSNGRGRAVLDALVDWVARLDGPVPAAMQTPVPVR
jgi:D-alanyl-D-alanine carboxypeptidase/D-alanyl-D-alanine-endopeptidase (penicillin-binding protein 4)